MHVFCFVSDRRCGLCSFEVFSGLCRSPYFIRGLLGVSSASCASAARRLFFMAGQRFILLCNVVWVPISAVVLFRVGCNLADFRATELLGSPNHEGWLSAILFAYFSPRCIMIYFLFLALATSLLKNHASKAQHPPRIKIKLEVFLEFDCFFFFVSLLVAYIYIFFKKSNQTRLTAGIKIVTSMSGGHGSLLEKSGPLPSGEGRHLAPGTVGSYT